MHALKIIENKDEAFKVLLWCYEKAMAQLVRPNMDFYQWVEKVHADFEKGSK